MVRYVLIDVLRNKLSNKPEGYGYRKYSEREKYYGFFKDGKLEGLVKKVDNGYVYLGEC